MNDIILSRAKALRHVKDYLIRYELQHCGSLHAYIVLWIQKDDIEQVTNNIIAVIPATYDEEKEEFIEPTDEFQRTLFKMVIWKQLHSCGER